jgi:hypothetical protein
MPISAGGKDQEVSMLCHNLSVERGELTPSQSEAFRRRAAQKDTLDGFYS